MAKSYVFTLEMVSGVARGTRRDEKFGVRETLKSAIELMYWKVALKS